MLFALHDSQAVIAREYGFKSWNDLRDHVEENSLSFAAAVDEFMRCATGGSSGRALRLLGLHPGIAHASLYTELLLGDAQAVRARLRVQPQMARLAGGQQNWEPLLYVCHTCLHQGAPERAEGLVAIARELLTLGANPDAQYHFNWHKELPRTALWGALCATAHLPLAEALLEGGANPTDGVSTHINAGIGNVPALELLHRFGLDVNGIPGGVPPLRYCMQWGDSVSARATGLHWLLEHGADPNLPWGELNDTPLHVAAQRWDLGMTELLVRLGADIHKRRADGRTARTVAELYGNEAVATWLQGQGARDELSAFERFIAACTRGQRVRADAMLQADPSLRTELRPEHHLMLQVPAERGDTAVLETMLACGFDPNARDAEGITALHRAAMGGRVESVRVLLGFGAAADAVDDTFAAPPLMWAAQGWRHNPQPGTDYPAAARLLIEAGTPLEWTAPPDSPDAERNHETLIELCRAAMIESTR
jgi:ankyrin repeat protein